MDWKIRFFSILLTTTTAIIPGGYSLFGTTEIAETDWPLKSPDNQPGRIGRQWAGRQISKELCGRSASNEGDPKLRTEKGAQKTGGGDAKEGGGRGRRGGYKRGKPN